jgi:hypothetical protein
MATGRPSRVAVPVITDSRHSASIAENDPGSANLSIRSPALTLGFVTPSV